MIQGTYGRTYFDSSASVGLPSLWANRLAERLATLGSTESALIWKVKALPSGRLKPRLVPSTRHTNGCETGGAPWRSPAVQESGITLERLVTKEGDPWMPGERSYDKTTGRHCQHGLAQEMQAAQWPTPTVADVEGGRKTRSGARGDEMLLNGLLFGETPNGSNAPTEKRGGRLVPNPIFAAWLMGFPPKLSVTILRVCSSLPSKDGLRRGDLPETQSFRKSRPKSSGRSKTSSQTFDLFG